MIPVRFRDVMRSLPRRIAAQTLSGLMPRRCVFCGVTNRGDERFLCPGCHDDLPWIRHACPHCARSLPGESAPRLPCASCQASPPPFTAAVAPLEYAFPVDAAIKAFKFRRRLFFAPAFAEILSAAAAGLPPDVDALLPVPLHRWRQLRRGFNQAAELAAPLAAATGLPMIGNVTRGRATPYQSGLGARERRRNLAGAFRVSGELRARHVVVVDDVITSGETCGQLARLALAHGAEKVSVLALARA